MCPPIAYAHNHPSLCQPLWVCLSETGLSGLVSGLPQHLTTGMDALRARPYFCPLTLLRNGFEGSQVVNHICRNEV